MERAGECDCVSSPPDIDNVGFAVDAAGAQTCSRKKISFLKVTGLAGVASWET
jgi:hypothetical protein